jgi:hypothetical protein
MNVEKVKEAVQRISGSYITLEEAKEDHKEFVAACLQEIGDSENLTPDELKGIQKVAQETSRNKLDKLEEFTAKLMHIIDMNKPAQF